MRGSSCGRTLGILVIASCVPVMAGAPGTHLAGGVRTPPVQSGLEFLHAGKYTEALKDFEAVVDSYPASSVADEALLAIARYQLDVQRNPMAAQATAESLLKKFPASDSVAMSYVVAGQATVAKGLTPGNVEAALASFDRVQRLFAGTEAVAPALVAAEIRSDALGAARRRSINSMGSPWCTRARHGRRRRGCRVPRAWRRRGVRSMRCSSCNVSSSPPPRAPRRGRPAPEHDHISLYVRPPARSPYGFLRHAIAGPAGKLKDVSALAFGPDGSLFVASKGGVVAVDQKGTTVRSISAVEPRALFVD